MAEESIRERIVQHCMASLEAVNGTGEYYFALVRIQRGRPGAEDVENLPAAFVAEGTLNATVFDETIAQDTNALLTRMLPLTVEIRIRSADEPWQRAEEGALETLINRALADVERAMLADPSRGRLALRTAYVGNSAVKDESSGLLASVKLQFEIHYRTSVRNPASLG